MPGTLPKLWQPKMSSDIAKSPLRGKISPSGELLPQKPLKDRLWPVLNCTVSVGGSSPTATFLHCQRCQAGGSEGTESTLWAQYPLGKDTATWGVSSQDCPPTCILQPLRGIQYYNGLSTIFWSHISMSIKNISTPNNAAFLINCL